jgi:drug/metabolite transporter (DMT)-like permease
MDGKVAPRIGVVILLGVSMCFSMNHIGARIGFDHGASVAAGVALRATSCALLMLAVIRLQGIAFAVPRELRGRALLAGVLIASQSYCLFAAVALIPPALALLVFQTSPMLYVLLTWALGKEKPSWSALPPMLLGLVGVAFALDLDPARLQARWGEIGAGTAWALGGALSMIVVYYLNANALKPLDGRLRTFIMTAITSVIVLAAGGSAGALVWPQDATGWTGFAVLAAAYCAGMFLLFYMIPRVSSTTTAALNFEPIALLFLAWLILGHTVTLLQIAGCLVTVGAIVWLALRKA